MNKNKPDTILKDKEKDKKISAKENYQMTMSETYVEPIHNCNIDKEK